METDEDGSSVWGRSQAQGSAWKGTREERVTRPAVTRSTRPLHRAQRRAAVLLGTLHALDIF